MNTQKFDVARPLSLLLGAWVVFLHVCFRVSAGPLWRDEAQTAAQAVLPSWHALWQTLRYDTFPPLLPAALSLLRLAGLPLSDPVLRDIGFLVGLLCAASVVGGLRLLGFRSPWVVAVLVLADPLVISEAASVRPYGLSLLGLLWTWIFSAKHLDQPSPRWLLFAAASATVAVQSNYSSALFVAAIGLAAFLMAARHRGIGRASSLFVPGLVAAVSLLPYLPAAVAARQWMAILRYQPQWREFLRTYLGEHSAAYPAGWLVLILLASYPGLRRSASRNPLVPYALATALLGAAVQIAFVEAAKVPLFPRYFLPCAVLCGLFLELRTAHLDDRVRGACVLVVLLLTTAPTWNWLHQRRTNADVVARETSRAASSRDLVVISPWFLHTSFQRYYTGVAPWVTVPPVEREPIVRYDQVRESILAGGSPGELRRMIFDTTNAGGVVWLVAQRYPQRDAVARRPAVPPEAHVTGDMYAAFRDYWESDVENALVSCCNGQLWRVSDVGAVWAEEHLLLSRWQADRGQAGRRPAGVTH